VRRSSAGLAAWVCFVHTMATAYSGDAGILNVPVSCCYFLFTYELVSPGRVAIPPLPAKLYLARVEFPPRPTPALTIS
jgi:hypothetical protein